MSDKPTILKEIFAKKRTRVEALKSGSFSHDPDLKAGFGGKTGTERFVEAFSAPSKINIIAEIKRASPSKGVINSDFDVPDLVTAYEKGGACAISVLTEEDYFQGCIEDLTSARNTTNLPILRKDFIFDELQIYESVRIGADAVLLIAAMLNDNRIRALNELAQHVGLGVLLEVHNESELHRALLTGAEVIGVNNRDLHTFEVNTDISKLLAYTANNRIMISESGLESRNDLVELNSLGYRGFLIGESFMRSDDPAGKLRSFQ